MDKGWIEGRDKREKQQTEHVMDIEPNSLTFASLQVTQTSCAASVVMTTQRAKAVQKRMVSAAHHARLF